MQLRSSSSVLEHRLLLARSMNSAALSLLAALLFVTTNASADGTEVPDRHPDCPNPARLEDRSLRRDARLTANSGIFSDSHSGGFALQAEALHRRGLLALGLVGDYGTAVFTPYRYWGGGAGAGISLPTPSWLRVDLLGVAGAHHYHGVGSLTGLVFAMPFAPIDPGVSATLPYTGAHLDAAFELGSTARFVLGVKALLDRDLGSVTKTSTTSTLFATPEAATHQIGGTRAAALLTLGGSFEL
jgi:hypothetical protein